MKKLFAIFALVSFVLATTPQAMAYSGCGSKKGKHGSPSLEDKLLKKFHMDIICQTDLNLSDEQVEKIKDLKIKLKKDLVQKKANIDLLVIDIKALLWKDVIDQGAINKLIDQKYNIKKQKAKALVASYSNFKTILSDEQKAKFKDLMYECYKK